MSGYHTASRVTPVFRYRPGMAGKVGSRPRWGPSELGERGSVGGDGKERQIVAPKQSGCLKPEMRD